MPLSAILRQAGESANERVSLAELTEQFGGRALGAFLLVFGLACMLPLPPGGTTIFGLPLLLLAPQLMMGSRAPWLPAKVRERTLATADLRRGLERLLPWLQRLEAISKPRFSILFTAWGQRLIGLVCTVLALVLILPIPLGNILPATAVTVLALSLVQRDGALALLGYALAATSAGVLVLAAGIVISAVQHLLTMLAAA